MIVTFKSKCGNLQAVIIWSMEFVRNEMKVMNNNNVVKEVLVTRILDTGIMIFGSNILVARILVIRFWPQDSGIKDSGHNHRGSGHKILVTGTLDTGIVILVTGMATGYNSTGHGQQSVCVTLSLVGKIARNSFHKAFSLSCHVVIAKQSFQWVSGKARKLLNYGHNFWNSF